MADKNFALTFLFSEKADFLQKKKFSESPDCDRLRKRQRESSPLPYSSCFTMCQFQTPFVSNQTTFLRAEFSEPLDT